MELPEPPECPVCLQTYGFISTIPRVLSCGHSACEDCIGQLPNAFPDTIRCPACTQLVKLPKPLCSLPKNIDLLRFSSLIQNDDTPPQSKTSNSLQEPEKDSSNFLPALWSREFYLYWKPWLLPENSISTEPRNSGSKRADDFCYSLYGCFTKCLRNHDGMSTASSAEKEGVCLVKTGIVIHKAETYSKFNYSYELKVLRALYEMAERERNELDLILNANSRRRRVCKAYGIWYCVDDNFVYLVCQRFGRSVNMLADVIADKNGEEKVRCMTSWAMAGLDICEAVNNLHLQGLSIGCLGASCFGIDEFNHAYVDICETLVAVRRAGMMIVGREAMCDEDLALGLENEKFEECFFISPEAVCGLLKIKGVQVGCGGSDYDAGFAVDVWSLASLLLWILIGRPFAEEMQVYLKYIVESDETCCNLFGWYTGWMERIACLFECNLKPDFMPLREILCKCLDFNPENRPTVLELWKSLREVIVKPDIDVLINFKQVNNKHCIPLCLLFGDLCLSVWRANEQSMGENQRIEVEISKIDKDVIEGISDGQIKCIDLTEHRDCITGFAIGGGFLFSSSFDKVVNVWSLQDYAHVHAFKGHEQRVTAVTYVDDEQPLCISGDNGGGICIWAASVPLGREPIKKLYEQKDWRYSGIHALAVSGSKHLYTGSGDKSIKAWSLQDYKLSCTMTGHKSAVSSLAVCNEVLYSGSWDGTVRLWCLSDHSLLAVLGENSMPGNVTSVMSIAADENGLVAAHDNGIVKIWYNDTLLECTQAHNGAVFSACKKGRWIFTGGWDKTVNVLQVLSEEEDTQIVAFGSILCDSGVTALLYWQGKLFIGQANRVIKEDWEEATKTLLEGRQVLGAGGLAEYYERRMLLPIM